jgi:hypothetical protein
MWYRRLNHLSNVHGIQQGIIYKNLLENLDFVKLVSVKAITNYRVYMNF